MDTQALDEVRDIVRATLRGLWKLTDEAVEAVMEFLDSPDGRRLRRGVAAGLFVAAPLITRLPVFRASRLGRLVGLAGGTALIVKAAEFIRDWERRGPEATFRAD